MPTSAQRDIPWLFKLVLGFGLIFCTGFLTSRASLANDFADALTAISAAPVSASKRVAIARYLSAECSKYLQALPRLAPRESAWLDGEIAAGRDPEAIMRSSEFARRALLNHFSRCTEGANTVLNANGPDIEVVGWATLISGFDDFDIEGLMRRSGSPQLEREAGRAAAFRLFAEPILDNIVLPHLQDRARQSRR